MTIKQLSITHEMAMVTFGNQQDTAKTTHQLPHNILNDFIRFLPQVTDEIPRYKDFGTTLANLERRKSPTESAPRCP